MVKRNHDIVEVSCSVVKETPAAYLIDAGLTKADKVTPAYVWVPKSECEWDDGDKTMQMPEWLATDKGLI